MPTEADPPAAPGILGSLRSFGDGLLASVEDRIELFSVELQEEKYRLIQFFIWIGAVFFVALLAIVFLSLAVVVYCWESAKLIALGGLAAGYAGIFVGLVFAFRRYVARQPRPFAATLREIKEDRACIPKEN